MKQKRQAAPRAAAKASSPQASHVEVPDQADDYRSSWNGARIKTIGTPYAGMKTKQTHRLYLPELCPASHNPLPGSTMLIFYKTRSRFLEVFSLSAYIQAAIGHPLVRDVEALTQAVALDCAAALGQKVYVEGRFQLRGLDQEVICITKAYPPKTRGKGKKGSKALRHTQAMACPRATAMPALPPADTRATKPANALADTPASTPATASAPQRRKPAGGGAPAARKPAAATERRPRKPTAPAAAAATAASTAAGQAPQPTRRVRAAATSANTPAGGTTGQRRAAPGATGSDSAGTGSDTGTASA